MEGLTETSGLLPDNRGIPSRHDSLAIMEKRNLKLRAKPYRELEDNTQITGYEKALVGTLNEVGEQLNDKSENGLIPQSLVDEKPHYEDFARIFQRVIETLSPHELFKGEQTYGHTGSVTARRDDGTLISTRNGVDGKPRELHLWLPWESEKNRFGTLTASSVVEYRYDPSEKRLEAKIRDVNTPGGDHQNIGKEQAIQTLKDYLKPVESETWGTVL